VMGPVEIFEFQEHAAHDALLSFTIAAASSPPVRCVMRTP
jgi:hypothetical protein